MQHHERSGKLLFVSLIINVDGIKYLLHNGIDRLLVAFDIKRKVASAIKWHARYQMQWPTSSLQNIFLISQFIGHSTS